MTRCLRTAVGSLLAADMVGAVFPSNAAGSEDLRFVDFEAVEGG